MSKHRAESAHRRRPRLRRPRRRLGLRRLGHGAAADREGLQRRRPRGGCALPRRGLRGDVVRHSSATSSDPSWACYGIQRIDAVSDCLIVVRCRRRRRLAGLRQHALRAARRSSTTTRRGAHITDWKAELAPYYDQAKRMLGVVDEPLDDAGRRGHEEGRRRHGRGRHLPPDPGRRVLRRPGPDARARRSPTRTSAAPVPTRSTCLDCGECMTGCRHNAKNTLVKNYLYLAEQNGAGCCPLTTVTRVRPRRAAAATTSTRAAPRPSSPTYGDQGRSPPSRSSSRRPRSAPRSCCTGCKAEGASARAVGPARAPLAHQLRVDPRRDRAGGRSGRLQPGRRDHVLVPPRRAHPHRARPLRQGQQLRCRCCRRCSPTATAPGRAGAPG